MNTTHLITTKHWIAAICMRKFVGIAFLLSSAFICLAQKNNTTGSDSDLLDSFIQAKGYKDIVQFSPSNIKQFWIDKSVISKDDLISVILMSSKNTNKESVLLPIKLVNVDAAQDCKVEVISSTGDMSFSVLNEQSEVLVKSNNDDKFINYNVSSASFHMCDASNFTFFIKFSSSEHSELQIRRIILSFDNNKDIVATMTVTDKTINTDMLIPGVSVVTFSGMNTLNATIRGKGTVVFADGATVTSDIPSGSTIGTGVIRALFARPQTVTLENITITGITSNDDSALIHCSGGNTVTLRNCLITGNTIANYAIRSSSGATSVRLVLDNVTVRGNTGSIGTRCNNIYPYSGKCFVNNVTCNKLIPYHSVIIISGDNKFAFETPAASKAKVIFTPGSIVRMSSNSTSLAGSSVFYVGTYDEATGTITTEDSQGHAYTATVVLNGTSVSISGSGKAIDAEHGLYTPAT